MVLDGTGWYWMVLEIIGIDGGQTDIQKPTNGFFVNFRERSTSPRKRDMEIFVLKGMAGTYYSLNNNESIN